MSLVKLQVQLQSSQLCINLKSQLQGKTSRERSNLMNSYKSPVHFSASYALAQRSTSVTLNNASRIYLLAGAFTPLAPGLVLLQNNGLKPPFIYWLNLHSHKAAAFSCPLSCSNLQQHCQKHDGSRCGKWKCLFPHVSLQEAWVKAQGCRVMHFGTMDIEKGD